MYVIIYVFYIFICFPASLFLAGKLSANGLFHIPALRIVQGLDTGDGLSTGPGLYQ